MRLREAEASCDLVLTQVVVVAETKGLALSSLEQPQAARDEQPVLALIEPFVGAGKLGCLAERDRGAHFLGLQRLGQLVFVQIRRPGQFRRRRGSLQTGGELASGHADTRADLLVPPR